MKKITLITLLFAFASIAHAQTLTITAVNTKSQVEFFKSSSRLLAVLNGETRADSTQKQDSTLSIIVFAKGVKTEIAKEDYNRILDLYASKHRPIACDCPGLTAADIQFLEQNLRNEQRKQVVFGNTYYNGPQ